MTQTTRDTRDNNPIVVATIIAIALGAMFILAFNLFVKPPRVTELNPVGKQGARSTAPQTAPAGAMNNGATSTTP